MHKRARIQHKRCDRTTLQLIFLNKTIPCSSEDSIGNIISATMPYNRVILYAAAAVECME